MRYGKLLLLMILSGALLMGCASMHAADVQKAREGDTLLVAVEEVNVQRRRISLAAASADDEGDWRSFTPKSPQGGGGSSLGSLAEQLQKALRTREGKS